MGAEARYTRIWPQSADGGAGLGPYAGSSGPVEVVARQERYSRVVGDTQRPPMKFS
jgi:hypothetical protein